MLINLPIYSSYNILILNASISVTNTTAGITAMHDVQFFSPAGDSSDAQNIATVITNGLSTMNDGTTQAEV